MKDGSGNNQPGLGINVIIILFIAHAFEHIYASGLPALFPLIRLELGLSYTQVAFLATARELVRGLMQIPAGYLSDRTGSSRIFIYGFLGVSSATLLTGLSPVYHMIVLFQVISGISSSSFHPSSYSLIMEQTPMEKIGKVISIHTIGGSVGGILVYALSGVFAAYFGWRSALIIWAVPGFLISYVFFKIFNSFEDNKKASGEKQVRVKNDIAAKTDSSNKAVHMVVFAFISMLMGMSSRALPVFLPLYFTVVYSQTIVASGLLTSIYFLASLVGLSFGGLIADKFNKLNIIIYNSGLVSFLLFILARSTMPLYALMGLIFSIGMIKAMIMPARNALAGLVSHEKQRGAMFGLIFGAGFLGTTAITIVYGYLSDLFGLQAALSLFGFIPFATAITSFAYKRFLGQPR